jgi:acetyl esterase/lipase
MRAHPPIFSALDHRVSDNAHAVPMLRSRRRSPTDLLNLAARRGRFQLATSIAYGEGPRQTLDVYRPRVNEPAPAVVFFYGGAWQSGHKETYLFVAAALAERGIVAVVPDYRLYPQVRFPAFIEDAALSIAWVKRNAADIGVDPARVFVMGHSAGAYIAAMLGLDRRWLAGVGLAAKRDLAGLIGIAGPYDFLPLEDDTLKVIFHGGTADTQPMTFVSGGEPPALLVTGRRDETVDPGNTWRLARRFLEAGSDAQVIEYARVGHRGVIGAFARPLRFLAPVLADVESFVRRIATARSGPVAPAGAAP